MSGTISGVEAYAVTGTEEWLDDNDQTVSYVVIDNEVRQWDAETGTFLPAAAKAGFLRRQLSTAKFFINKLI